MTVHVLSSGYARFKQAMPWLVLTGVLVLYAWIQTANFTPACTEEDTDGYLTLAKRMARGGPIGELQPDPFLYHSHVWVQNARGLVMPKYDPGYPALMAAAWRLGGDRAMFWISPLAGGLALLGAFLLFRLWLDPWPSVLALVSMVFNPMFISYTVYPLTHAADLCFIAWGMYFLWRWLRSPSPWTGAAAGLALGYAGLVRHGSSVLLLAAGVATVTVFWRRLARGRPSDTAPAPAVAGWGRTIGAILALVLTLAAMSAVAMAYNAAVFGAPWLSGYGLSGEQTAFAWAYFLDHYANLDRGLIVDCFYFLFPLAVLGILLTGPWPERMMRLAWLLPLYVLYTAYYWVTAYMSYYRFMYGLLPLVIGMAYCFLDYLPLERARRYGLMTLVCGLVLVHHGHEIVRAFRGNMVDVSQRGLANAADVVAACLPDDAVVLAAPPFHVFIGTRERFRQYNLDVFTSRYARNAFPRWVDPLSPEYANLSYWQRQAPRGQELRFKEFRKFYADVQDADFNALKRELVKSYLKKQRTVAFLVPVDRLNREKNELGPGLVWKPLREWDTPWNGRWGVYGVTLEPLK